MMDEDITYRCTCCEKRKNEENLVYFGRWHYCYDCFLGEFDAFIDDVGDTYQRVLFLWIESNKRLEHVEKSQMSTYYSLMSDRTQWKKDYERIKEIEKRRFEYFLKQNNKFIELIKNIRDERNKIID